MPNGRTLLAKRSKKGSEFNIYRELIYFYMPHIFKEQHNCNFIKFSKRNQNLKKSQNLEITIWRKYLADHVITTVFYTLLLTI